MPCKEEEDRRSNENYNEDKIKAYIGWDDQIYALVFSVISQLNLLFI